MATTPATSTPQFLAGHILVDRGMFSSWLPVVSYLIPLTTGALNSQLTDVQTQITNLLASTPDPSIIASKIVIPIDLVNDFKFALATFDYQFNGVNRNDYRDTVEEVGSVFDVYSIAYFSGRSIPYIIY
jgi:hypothetical protein